MKKTNNSKKVLLILMMSVMLLTGCTKSFKDEKTNKVYTENILCKPTDSKSLEAYEANENVNLKDLPDIWQIWKIMDKYICKTTSMGNN